MDKNLQKKILKVINDNNGVAEWNDIKVKTMVNRGGDGVVDLEKHKTIIKHQLDLLEEEDKIIRKELLPKIDYILTPRGHLVLGSCWKRAWYFVLYDKHNLFAFLALVISIISLVVSVYH